MQSPQPKRDNANVTPDDARPDTQTAAEDAGGERWEPPHALARELDRITKLVERMNLGDYVGLLQRPGRLLWLNFLAGLARGLGTILGATVLVYLLVGIMQRIIASHFPGLGTFFEEFLRILQQPKNG